MKRNTQKILSIYMYAGFIVCTLERKWTRKNNNRIKPIFRLHVLLNENVCCCCCCCYCGCRCCRPRCRLLFARVFCVVVCFIGFHAFIFNRTPDCVCVCKCMGHIQQFSVFFLFFYYCLSVCMWIWQWALKWMMLIMMMVWCKMHYFLSTTSFRCAYITISILIWTA